MTDLLSLNANKAGLSSLDNQSREEISRKIHEASKDTLYFKHQTERQKKIHFQIKNLIESASKLTREEREKAKKEMDSMAIELQQRFSDFGHIIVHLDMDMFFAAVEIRDDPVLADQPVAVGSKSMISTSNYVARKFGVRAGMAGFIGLKLCPQLKIIHPNFKKYKECSDEVMSVIAEYDPNFYSPSMDEAYLDITGFVRSKYSLEVCDDGGFIGEGVWNKASEVVEEIRRRIVERTNLTCSCGIANNKMLAKVCTDLNKPDGQYLLKITCEQDVRNFLSQTSVRKIPGIGPVQSQYLIGLGINTCKDLYESRDLIYLLFTPSLVNFYLRVSLGISSHDIDIHDESSRKSLGCETTFKSSNDINFLSGHLRSLAKELSEDLKSRDLSGKTITIRIKWATFDSIVRSKSLSFHVNDEDAIFKVARGLLQTELRERRDNSIRLLGIRLSNFPSESKSDKKLENESQSNILSFVKRFKKEENDKPCDFLCIYCSRQFSSDLSLENHLKECNMGNN